GDSGAGHGGSADDVGALGERTERQRVVVFATAKRDLGWGAAGSAAAGRGTRSAVELDRVAADARERSRRGMHDPHFHRRSRWNPRGGNRGWSGGGGGRVEARGDRRGFAGLTRGSEPGDEGVLARLRIRLRRNGDRRQEGGI